MQRLRNKVQNIARRKQRVRAKISGDATRPRLSVHVSNRHVTAQLIDDTNHATLAFVSSVGNKNASGTMTERAEWAGKEIAKKAKSIKVKQVVFDRNGKLYHGRIKVLADAARAEGMEF
jgi:large subunit ribosomal protein L18